MLLVIAQIIFLIFFSLGRPSIIAPTYASTSLHDIQQITPSKNDHLLHLGYISALNQQALHLYKTIQDNQNKNHPVMSLLKELFIFNHDQVNYSHQTNYKMPAFYLNPMMVGYLLAEFKQFKNFSSPTKNKIEEMVYQLDSLTVKDFPGQLDEQKLKDNLKNYFNKKRIRRLVQSMVDAYVFLHKQDQKNESFYKIMLEFFIKKNEQGSLGIQSFLQGMKKLNEEIKDESDHSVTAPTYEELNKRKLVEDILNKDDVHEIIPFIKNEANFVFFLDYLYSKKTIPYLSLNYQFNSVKCSFPDCMETALRNLLNVLLAKEGQNEVDFQKLNLIQQITDPLVKVHPDLINFFQKYPNFNDSLQAHIDWAKLLSNIQGIHYVQKIKGDNNSEEAVEMDTLKHNFDRIINYFFNVQDIFKLQQAFFKSGFIFDVQYVYESAQKFNNYMATDSYHFRHQQGPNFDLKLRPNHAWFDYHNLSFKNIDFSLRLIKKIKWQKDPALQNYIPYFLHYVISHVKNLSTEEKIHVIEKINQLQLKNSLFRHPIYIRDFSHEFEKNLKKELDGLNTLQGQNNFHSLKMLNQIENKHYESTVKFIKNFDQNFKPHSTLDQIKKTIERSFQIIVDYGKKISSLRQVSFSDISNLKKEKALMLEKIIKREYLHLYIYLSVLQLFANEEADLWTTYHLLKKLPTLLHFLRDSLASEELLVEASSTTDTILSKFKKVDQSDLNLIEKIINQYHLSINHIDLLNKKIPCIQ